MKRTMTIKFELTQYQYHQIKALGRTLWADQSFSRDELCRRVLLVGADRMLASSNGDRLLEGSCQPSQRATVS